MRRHAWLIPAIGLLLSACRRRESVPPAPSPILPFDGAAAFDEVRRFVAIRPRDAATPGAERAALYLRDRLRELGVEAEVDAFADLCPVGTATFRNVIGRIPGQGKGLVILGSHYDTQAGIGAEFEGANDGGSSTGVLLELARCLAAGPARSWETWLVFFDGEEAMRRYGPADGLHGSRHMARQLAESGRAADVKAVIVLDMIGDRDLTVTVPRNGASWLISEVFESARLEGARDKFSLYPYEIGDDHDPFHQAGLPAVDLIDFHFGSGPGRNDYWHTMEDRMDKIAPESLDLVGRVALRLLARMADRVEP
ncbi:MAG TPA: M28 family peptidase [Kiritimatiellia bacterium]|nr:M28 family peptidase [Kiritimatiellia bacterium]HRZ12540.1 M28 family peptidase [Kiritimatiellia bacterium]HSA17618.1 M28 family peptidase [Kiritimatiellia bacterium]